MVIVHRPKYDDWAFPKGKLEAGESWETAALREVEEETALTCELGAYLGSTQYPVRDGTKEVRYFRMTANGDCRRTRSTKSAGSRRKPASSSPTTTTVAEALAAAHLVGSPPLRLDDL